jgi:two-component system OmpR family response regulator
MAEEIAGSDSAPGDYVTKPFVPEELEELEELVARVRAVLRRHAPRPTARLRVADLRLDARGRQAWRGDRALELTAREFDLLECLMRHAGQVLTHRELLEQVWGSDGETKVVKVHVAHLRQKLNAAGKRNLIHTVRGVGYVLRE